MLSASLDGFVSAIIIGLASTCIVYVREAVLMAYSRKKSGMTIRF